MVKRRTFLKHAGLLTAAAITSCKGGVSNPSSSSTSSSSLSASADSAMSWTMPDESHPHIRTWMAFGASPTIWEPNLLPEARRNLAKIANTIAQYEPVSMLVREDDYDVAQPLLDDGVELIVTPIDDVWIRDTGPVFAIDDRGNKAAIDFNFNGWGNKQAHPNDARVAQFVADRAGVPVINTDLILEGGGIEVDGEGTAIITESCMLNDNRNPGVSKAEFEAELMPLLGLDKIIWLPGIAGMDITDGHIDFYARFVTPGVVLAALDLNPGSFDREVTQEHLEILEAATDASDQPLEIITLEAPLELREDFLNDEFAAGYIGFYLCNDAVIAQEFGDPEADAAVYDTLQELFPNREIEQLNVDAIAAGGGSIHCVTQQEPATA